MGFQAVMVAAQGREVLVGGLAAGMMGGDVVGVAESGGASAPREDAGAVAETDTEVETVGDLIGVTPT